jgi:uncharacterized protein
MAECIKKINTLPTVVASFGSGGSLNRIGVEEAREWGAFNWASLAKGIPLMDVFSDGSADMIDDIAQLTVNTLEGNHYLRFQPLLKENTLAFSANRKNLQKLIDAATNFLTTEEGNNKMNKLVKLLTE